MPVSQQDLETALRNAFPIDHLVGTAISQNPSVPDLIVLLNLINHVSHLVRTLQEIIDVSSGCGENYAVVIVSSAFEGKMTLARHRMVNDLLKEPISQMHAFSQKTFTPKQWEADQLKKKEAAEMKTELKTTVAESDPPVSAA